MSRSESERDYWRRIATHLDTLDAQRRASIVARRRRWGIALAQIAGVLATIWVAVTR